MSALKVHRLATPPTFRFLGESPALDPSIEKQVADIWRSATGERPHSLIDNDILAAELCGDVIHIMTVPYRRFFAQAFRPELIEPAVTALAVSGILTCDDRLVFGRRSKWVTQDPGTLELVPSGSLDANMVSDGQLDIMAQLDREAAEELGIDASELIDHRLVGLVEDGEGKVIDLVIRARVKCSWHQLEDRHRRLEHPEYSSLHAMSPRELQQLKSDGSSRISGVSSAILEHFCATQDWWRRGQEP